MKCKNTIAGLTAMMIIGLSQASYADTADTVDNAFKFCRALDATGMLSKPCDVSGWNHSIDVTMDTSSSEARKICSAIVAQASRVGASFDRGWKVRIYSPYSNGNTIAQCSF